MDEIVQKETVALKEAMMQLSENGTQSFDPRICLLTSVVNGLTAAVCERYLAVENIARITPEFCCPSSSNFQI